MSTVVSAHDTRGVPQPIVEKLQAVIRRARSVLLIRGTLAVVSVALICLLCGMAIDSSFTIFSTAVRASISLALLAIVVASAYVFLLRPLARTLTLTGVARIVESRHPELEERISSAVELLTSQDIPELRGSDALIAELAKEAVGQVDLVSPEREFTLRTARPFIISASAAAAVLLLLFAIWPSATARLFARVVAPFANIGNVHARDIEVKPGDVVLAAGDSLRIEVLVPHDRVKSARLRRTSEGSVEFADQMKPLSADDRGYPRFFLGMPAVTDSFRYRIHAGGAITKFYQVTVVPRPAVEEFVITYDYPSYMSRDAHTALQTSGDVRGPVGSRVRMVAHANTKIQSAQMLISGLPATEAKVTALADGGSECAFQLILNEELIVGRTWTLRMKDEHGFLNFPTEYLIAAEADQPPTIAIVNPGEERVRLKPTDVLPLGYRATDDYGVAEIDLLATLDGRALEPRRIPLPSDRNRAEFVAQTLFDLAEVTRDGGRVVTLQLQVNDNLPADLKGPHTARSNVLTITLDSTSETYFELQAAEDYASVRDVLQRVLADLLAAKKQTSDLDQAVDTQQRLAEAVLERIDEIRDSTASAESQLLDLGDSLPNSAFAALTNEVVDLAETDVKSARTRAGQIKLSDEPKQRVDHSRAADQHVDRAIARTNTLLERLEETWKQLQDVADLKDLAARQEQLADQIAAAELQEFSDLPLAEEQMEVAEEIAEVIAASPEIEAQVREMQKQQAEDLVRKAQELAEEQDKITELTEAATKPKVDPKQLQAQIAEEIAKEQERIAKDAQDLDRDVEKADMAGKDKSSDLADKPKSALQDLKQGKLEDAAEEAKAAAQQLAQAAQALDKDQPVADGDDAQGDPQKGDPQKGDPQKGDPQKGDPQKGDPQKGDPQKGDPQKGDPQKGDPQKGDPQKGDPQKGDPEKGAEDMPAEKSGNSDDGEPQDGQPEDAVAEKAKPQNGKPQPGDEQPLASRKSNAKLSQDAAQLAERQQKVAQQLEALAQGELEAALEMLQQKAAEGAMELADKTDAVAQAMQLLDQPPAAQKKAAQAAGEAVAAAGDSMEAAQQLGAAADAPADAPEAGEPGEPMVNKTPPAQQAKQAAVNAQEKAAKSLQNTAKALQELAEQIPTGPAEPMGEALASLSALTPAAGDLAEAVQSAAGAASAMKGAPQGAAAAQQAAAQSSQQAAQALAQAAQAAAQAAGVPDGSSALANALAPGRSNQPSSSQGSSPTPSSQPAQGAGEQGRIGGTMDNELQLKLKEYGISASQWTRLPGHLKSQIRQSNVAGAPEEYRALVRRYFRELARNGTQSP